MTTKWPNRTSISPRSEDSLGSLWFALHTFGANLRDNTNTIYVALYPGKKFRYNKSFFMLPHKANKKSKGTDNILFTWFSLKGFCCPFSGTNSLNSLFSPLLNITLYSRFNIEQLLSGKWLKKIFWKKRHEQFHVSYVTDYQFLWWSRQGANTWITGHERDCWWAGDFPSIAFQHQSRYLVQLKFKFASFFILTITG